MVTYMLCVESCFDALLSSNLGETVLEFTKISVLQKNRVLWVFFVQQNMVEITLPDGLETSGRRAYR